MIWLGAGSDARGEAYVLSGRKGDYYSLLVSGFVRGHLYMDVVADPRLESTDRRVLDRTPTLLDANYYKGHFYLYSGVVPAALLLLPYRLLTGQDLAINAASVTFWLLGFGASLFWLRAWWRHRGPEKGALLASLAVAILAFFPATSFLVRRSMFYELPLVAGYAFISIFFAGIYGVLTRKRKVGSLLAASAGLGLAVGCHPNHILLMPLLAWAGIAAVRDPVGEAGSRWVRAAAAIAPAALIGAALAWYNYARFGDIFEFGFKYGQNGYFSVKQSLFVPRFLWANIRWYFLTPPALTPYFPFVFPGDNTFRPAGYSGAEAMHGQLIATLLMAWAGAGAVAAGWRRRFSGGPFGFGTALGYGALVALAFVGILQIRANRYMVDFATPLAWLMVVWGSWAWIGLGRSAASCAWTAGFSALVAVGSAFYVLAAVQQFDQYRNTRPAGFAAISRALNVPYQWLYRSGMPRPGLLDMKVRFSPQKVGVIEPLVTTGTPGYSDSVYVAQYPNGLVQFSFNHKGYGGPISPLIPVDLGSEHEIEITMGSFYPPIEDAFFNDYSANSARLLKRLAYLRMDGRVITSATMAFYEAPPWSRQVGENRTTLTEFKTTFSGSIREVHTVSVAPLMDLLYRTASSGILRYKAQFPPRAPLSGLPLLGVGSQGNGNLIFAKAQGGAAYQVEMDDWGYPALAGKPFTAAPGEHDIEFVLGPVLARSHFASSWKGAGDLSVLADRFVVSIDGTVLGNFKVTHHLDALGKLTPGANPQGFSTAEAEFGGTLEPFPLMDSEVEDLLKRAVESSKP
jgi:hypothetical protein